MGGANRGVVRGAWIVAVAAAMAVAAAAAENGGVAYNRDGSVRMENGLVALTASNRVGADYGIFKWVFKPTGHEMIDVLYGQTDYVEGHVLGERWDGVEFRGYMPGTPDTGGLLVARLYGTAKDGSGSKVIQEASGGYRLRKTWVLRRDLAVVEVRYELENVSGKPCAFSLRLHSAMSPGARGRYQRRDDSIFLDTDAGVVELDQTLAQDKYHEKYKNDKFFTKAWESEPKRAWVWGKLGTPPLKDNWAAQVNRTNGDGMVFVIDRAALLGYYNCPGITLEPVMKAAALARGETWQATVFLGAFTGAKGRRIVGATPLYVVTQPLTLNNGTLAGEVIPLFRGTLRVTDAKGKAGMNAKADPTAPVAVRAEVGAGWTIVALDTKGAVIGSIDATGHVKLSEPRVEMPKRTRPEVAGDVYIAPGSEAAIRTFLDGRDFTVQCAWEASGREKMLARALARRLGAGLCWTNPGGKMLVVGAPGDNEIVKNVGLLKNSVTADWPGPGKGAVLLYDNFEDTQRPVLLLTGSDGAGAAMAAGAFAEKFLADRRTPRGLEFWATSTGEKIQPYTRRPWGAAQSVTLEAARGEYEPAQLVITAYDELRDVEVTVAPLVNAKTGKPIDRRYATYLRRRNGPLWLRWVNYYPIDRKGGWTGYPDPLLERPERHIAAGRSQALWLTAIISERAEPGTYTSAITCKTDRGTMTIPLTVKVWDFTVPRDGLMGEPYMSLKNLPSEQYRELRANDVRALVTDFVEHGMRVIHLGPPDTFRWHFSPRGEYKGLKLDWLEVNADGTVALDTSTFDWLIDTCDGAANGFSLRYMVYIQCVVNGYGDFRRALPNRFKDKPKREGHWYQGYYAQEMLALFKQHLVRRGLLKRCVLKISDEPRGFDWWWDQFTLAAREIDLPFMTCFNSVDWSQADKGLGKVAVWQPLYMKYDAAFFKKARAAGGLISWYNCGPPPKISIHARASEIRGYLWQAAKADLDVVCWWGIQCWSTHHDVWYSRYSHWNSVVYPPDPEKPPFLQKGKAWCDSAPIGGVRWELIREGMEDANYVVLLRRLIARARAKKKDAAADRAQAVLDGLWRDVFPTLNDYAPDYAKFYECRRKVAEAIVVLQGEVK